jgi:hypothetical protein
VARGLLLNCKPEGAPFLAFLREVGLLRFIHTGTRTFIFKYRPVIDDHTSSTDQSLMTIRPFHQNSKAALRNRTSGSREMSVR